MDKKLWSIEPTDDHVDGVNTIAVRISEECAPWVYEFDDAGKRERVRDWGNADWPEDEEIAQALAERYGIDPARVTVQFFDTGDDLSEGLYNVSLRGRIAPEEVGRVVVRY